MKFVDQTGHQIELPSHPKRIISLVPSQTELLFDLGLEEEIVGITKFCIHPDVWFHSKKRVGGTKDINFERIEELNPDLIIANKEENDREQIELLMEKYPVWISDIKTLDDAYAMIRSIGEMTDRAIDARKVYSEIAFRFETLKANKPDLQKNRVAYFIWKNPWMAAGKDTFIDHLLAVCGFENVFAHEESRYPEITIEDFHKRAPEIIFLSSEPYPFKEKHIQELKEIAPYATIITVDGELFSWYGSRLMHSPQYFLQLMRGLSFS